MVFNVLPAELWAVVQRADLQVGFDVGELKADLVDLVEGDQ